MVNDYMFLDTVWLAIPLSHKPIFAKFPTENRDLWLVEKNGYCTEYSINKKILKMEMQSCGRYLPTVMWRRFRDGRDELVLDFSIPKLIHSHNFFPVFSSSIGEVYCLLLDALYGVYGLYDVDEDDLKRGILSRMDCSYVVRFETADKLRRAMNRIKSANLNSQFSIDEPAFSPTSSGVTINCASWQFVFYDKSKEYADGLKKMLREPDYPDADLNNNLRPSIVHRISGSAKYESKGEISFLYGGLSDVLNSQSRFMQCELRVNSREKIKRALKRIGEERRNLTLEEAVTEHIPQRILQYHWQMIIDGLPRNDLKESSMRDICETFLNSSLKPKDVEKAIGMAYLTREFDAQDLKERYNERHGRNGYRRLMENVQLLPRVSVGNDSVQPITDAIFGNIFVESRIEEQDEREKEVCFSISITITSCTKNYSYSLLWSLRRSIRAPPEGWRVRLVLIV